MPNPVSPVGERQEEDDDFDNRGMNSYDESFFANESNYNESFGTLSTTETNSKQQQEQPYNMSNIVVADDSEKTLDPDIDIAAEQIVNEFAEHVNRNQGQNGDMYVADNIYDSQTSSSHTGDYDEDGEPAVGVMSHSMAAGGFEELVTALDDGDHTDEPDEIFEEFDDDSYDEEEVTEEDDEEMEEELVDDADLDVIMEEAVNIMHTPDGTSAAANISPHSSDNEEEEEANDGEYLDNDRAGENEDTDKEQTPELQEKDIIMGGTLEQISPGVTMDEVPEEKAMPDETVGVEGDEDGAMMEFSESSRASNGAPLMGDALLGEMSEVSNMTSDQQQLGSSLLKNDKSERSTKSAATRQSASSRKSAASRQSASSKQSAASRQSASSKHIAASMQSANASSVKSNSERSNNSKAVIGAGVALGATATGIALASENLPDTQTAPVNPSVAAPLVEPRQQNVQLAQHEPRQPPPPQQQKQQEQQKQRPNRPSRDPSGLSLAPGVDGNVQTAAKQSPDTAKTKEMDVKKEEAVKEVKDIAVPVTPTVPELKDLEAGTSPNEATKEESPFVVAKNNEPAESKRSNRFLCLIALICLLVIVLIIVLSVLLPRNKDGASKELAPTMASPPLPSPTQSPANPTPSPGSLKPSPGTVSI